MNIEFTTTEPAKLIASSRHHTWPLTDCDEATKRAALRAIAEHLGPEATIETLGTDANAKQFADAQTREAIADARFDPDKTPPAKCIEILRTKYDAIHESLGGTLEALEAAIRAAGYDPDEVGAAEVIEKLSGATLGDVSKPYESIGGTLAELESAMASAHGRDYTMPADTAIGCIMMLIEQRDTARAQLREWRETVGPVLGAWDRYDNAPFEDRPAKDSVLTNWIRHQSPKFRRLLSATPDKDSSSPNGLSNPEGDVASPVAAHGGRKSAALFDDSASKRWQRLYQETQARLDESAAEYDRLRKRVERAELDRDAWKAMAEGEQRRREEAEQRAASAETAIAALRNVLEIRQRLDRGEVVPTTWMGASTQSAADALTAYDAGKGGEATIEQPQARVEGICPTCIGAGWKTEQYVGNVAVRRSCPDCNGTGRAPVAEHAQCSVNPFSSRMCERGVKGCDVEHAPKQPSPHKPRDDSETYEIPAAPPDWPRTQKEPWRIAEHSPGAPRYVSEDEERRIQDAVDADMAGPAAPPDDTPEAIARHVFAVFPGLGYIGHCPSEEAVAARIRALVEKADREGRVAELHAWRGRLSEWHGRYDVTVYQMLARLRELEKGGAK